MCVYSSVDKWVPTFSPASNILLFSPLSIIICITLSLTSVNLIFTLTPLLAGWLDG